MWIQATALMLVCLLWPAEAQGDANRRKSIWENPIKFDTKAKDKCTMMIRGQGQYAKLRVTCQGDRRSYWCEYVGKPHTCGAFSKNPRHYFVQMMWILRKLQNACQGPRQIKPHMCRKATDESLMVFSSASFSSSQPEASSKTVARPSKQSAGAQTAPAPTRPNSAKKAAMKAVRAPQRLKSTRRPSPQPTTPPVESTPKRMARQYCWRSLQGICSFAIGLFRS